MNSKNQNVKRELKDTWLCRNCGTRIIPFEKSSQAGFVEGLLVLIGVAFIFVVNLFLGLILIALSVIISVIRSGGKKRICPSCESENIIPAMSPMAQRAARR